MFQNEQCAILATNHLSLREVQVLGSAVSLQFNHREPLLFGCQRGTSLVGLVSHSDGPQMLAEHTEGERHVRVNEVLTGPAYIK